MTPKNIICLWFNKDAGGGACFYTTTFPDNKVTVVHHAPLDCPSGKNGVTRCKWAAAAPPT